MAGVSTEKRGNKWRYRFDVSQVDGKRVRISYGGFATEIEAMAAGIMKIQEYEKTGETFTPCEILIEESAKMC